MKKNLLAAPLLLLIVASCVTGCANPDQSSIAESDRKHVGGDLAGRPADVGDKMREAKEKYDKAHPKTYFGPDSNGSGTTSMPGENKS